MKKLAKCNSLMFKEVLCAGYMKKINDGVFICCDGSTYYYENKDTKTEIPSYDIGGPGVIKTYRELVNKDFVGVIVGFSMIKTEAELYLDIEDTYDGREVFVVKRNDKEMIKCAKVYYGCNKSRFVPLDAIKEVR